VKHVAGYALKSVGFFLWPLFIGLLVATWRGWGTLAANPRLLAGWAALVAFGAPLPGVPDAASTGDGMLAWYARNSSKPGRDGHEAFVLHASADWSRVEFDQPAHAVERALLDRFSELTGQAMPRARAESISDSSKRVLPMPASPRVTIVRPRRAATQRSSSEPISDRNGLSEG